MNLWMYLLYYGANNILALPPSHGFGSHSITIFWSGGLLILTLKLKRRTGVEGVQRKVPTWPLTSEFFISDISSQRWKVPVSCLRKLVSPPSELSGFLATQSKYSFSLKQDHQRWRYVIVDHLTIWFHMKRFVQSGWLDQWDGEDGCLCLRRRLRCAFGHFWSILSNLCQSWSILPVWVLKFG